MKTMPLPNAFAETCILASHLSEMKSGSRRCTPKYDRRLYRFFGMEEGFWMRLQLHYEM